MRLFKSSKAAHGSDPRLRLAAVLLAASIGVFGATGLAQAARHAVDTDLGCPTYSTLVNGIDAAGSGDVLRLECATATDISFPQAIKVGESVTLDASASGAAITLDGGSTGQLFTGEYEVDLTLEGLTLANASTSDCSSNTGGAVYSDYATLTISDDSFVNDTSCANGGAISVVGGSTSIAGSTFSDNGAAAGGGVYVTGGGSLTVDTTTFTGTTAGGAIDTAGAGDVTVTGSTFSNNAAASEQGGAIDASGCSSVTITGSTFSGNSADEGGALYLANDGSVVLGADTYSDNSAREGGALFATGGSPSDISDSTFSSNASGGTGGGGAIYLVGAGAQTVANSTFEGNAAGNEGGGAILLQGGSSAITSSTFSGNTAPASRGDALSETGGQVSVGGTILADAGNGDNCLLDGGAVTDGDYNLTDGADDCGLTDASDFTGVDPKLAPLGANGGPTQTMALAPTSPAIDKVPLGQCPATDQRGVARPANQQPKCDIGAYEYVNQPQTITFTAPAAPTYTYGDAPFSVSASGGGSGEPVTFSIDAASASVCSAGPSANNHAAISITGTGTCIVDANQTAGTGYLKASQASETFIIKKAKVNLAYTGPKTFVRGKSATLSATVKNASTHGPAAGVPVRLVLSPIHPVTQSCGGTTTSAGVVSCQLKKVAVGAGARRVEVVFAGTADYLAAKQDTNVTVKE